MSPIPYRDFWNLCHVLFYSSHFPCEAGRSKGLMMKFLG